MSAPQEPKEAADLGIVSPSPRGTRRKRWLRRGLILFSALIGLYAGLIVSVAYLSLHPPHNPVRNTPREEGLRYEEVRFSSAAPDALSLRGWYLPAEKKPRGLILFCHGRQGSRASVLAHAAYLHRAGFAVFSFDFRAYGDADGMSTIGWREVGDALGAVKYLRSRPDTRGLPLGVFGLSMGAAVAIQATAASPEIRCVVADSSYASLDHAVDQRFRGLLGPSGVVLSAPVQWVGEQMMGTTAAAVSPLAAIPHVAPRPVLLIHGTADALIRADDSRELYKAAGEPKELWLVPGAAHVRSHRVARAEYERRVTAFFKRQLVRR
jgi:fermentation-respiration switch protein FrsA (DUF1100 family)